MALPKDLNGLSPEERKRVKVAIQALDEGSSKRSLAHQLAEDGMDPEEAAAIVDKIDAFRRANHHHAGLVSIALGGILTFIGLPPIFILGMAGVVWAICFLVWAVVQFLWGWNSMKKRIAMSAAQRTEDGV